MGARRTARCRAGRADGCGAHRPGRAGSARRADQGAARRAARVLGGAGRSAGPGSTARPGHRGRPVAHPDRHAGRSAPPGRGYRSGGRRNALERSDHGQRGTAMIPLLLLAGALLVAPSWSPGRARLFRLRQLVEPEAGARRRAGRWTLPAGAGAAAALLTATSVGGVGGGLLGAVLGVAVALGCRRLLAREAAPAADPLRLAGGWDLLAACLRSGLPVSV